MNILIKIARIVSGQKRKYELMYNSLVDQHSQIGDHTYIGFNCIITKARLGRYCSIANNINIGPGEHDLSQISTSSVFYTDPFLKLTEKDVTIGNDVWIGSNCIIRRGVTIGDGAVVGANSFVNNDIPPFAIFAGSPARLIRYRFDEDKIKKIMTSRWWDFDIAEARKIMNSLPGSVLQTSKKR